MALFLITCNQSLCLTRLDVSWILLMYIYINSCIGWSFDWQGWGYYSVPTV